MTDHTWVDPIFGWREMNATAKCPSHHKPGLLGATGACVHNRTTDPAQCIIGGRSLSMRGLLSYSDMGTEIDSDLVKPGSPHDAAECPSARMTGNPCGYYCRYEPSLTTSSNYWVYTQAIGKTILHEDGFRAERLRLVAIVFRGHALTLHRELLTEVSNKLGIPVLDSQTPIARCAELGIPFWQVRRAAGPGTGILVDTAQSGYMSAVQLVSTSPSIPRATIGGRHTPAAVDTGKLSAQGALNLSKGYGNRFTGNYVVNGTNLAINSFGGITSLGVIGYDPAAPPNPVPAKRSFWQKHRGIVWSLEALNAVLLFVLLMGFERLPNHDHLLLILAVAGTLLAVSRQWESIKACHRAMQPLSGIVYVLGGLVIFWVLLAIWK